MPRSRRRAPSASPVIMLARPALPEVATAATVEEVLAWLDHVSAPSTARGV